MDTPHLPSYNNPNRTLTLKLKNHLDAVIDLIERLIMTDIWVSLIWVALGVSTWVSSSQSHDILSVFGPMVVGCFKFSSPRIGSAAYYTLAFAVASDRVIGYASADVWNPLFVWLLVGTYMAQAGRDTNGG